jgi:hypothetical protein
MSKEIEDKENEVKDDDGFIEYPVSHEIPPESPEEPGDTETPAEEETPELPEKEPEKKVEAEEPPAQFTLEEDDPFRSAEEEPPKDEGLTEIVHQGQRVSLTKEQLINLAQKGFDYDLKVGRHGKIVQMIEADPNLAEVVNNYWQGKLKAGEDKPVEAFKVKPLGEYENEVDWLQDNLKTAIANLKPSGQPVPQPAESPGAAAKKMLAMHDPKYSGHIIPKLAEYIPRLSVLDYQKIDSDPTGAKLLQFYDYVKEQELAKVNKPPASTPGKKTGKPSFRVQSGGGSAPQDEDKAELAWNKPRAEFLAELEKVKYG